MLTYPNIDPVIIHIYGNLAIRWYSLAYIIGFLLCYWWLKFTKYGKTLIAEDDCEKLLSWLICGVVVGARLFDCIFYNLKETISDPLSIFRVWEGGMSFHGGAIGVFCVFYLFSKKYKIPTLRILDYCLIMAPLALFFGRIANFINAELYGNITYTSPFRMVFPTDYLHQPRHPSQLYEAFAEGLCLFGAMFAMYKKTDWIRFSGVLTGAFGMMYSVARFVCEFFRRPEIGNLLGLTAGQWLSILMFSACCGFTFWRLKKAYII